MNEFIWYKINIMLKPNDEIIEINEVHIADARRLVAKLRENNFNKNFLVEFLEMATASPKAKLESFAKKTDIEKATLDLKDFLRKYTYL